MKNKSWVDQSARIRTMHPLAFIIVLSYMFFIGYALIKINLYLSKEFIKPEVWERMIMGLLAAVGSIVLMVVAYFFGKKEGKIEGELETLQREKYCNNSQCPVNENSPL